MNQDRMFKVGGALLLVVLLVIGYYASFVYEKPYVPFEDFDQAKIQSKSVVLLDRTTKDVIFSKEGDMRLAPASLTKILTVYTAIMKNVELSQEVTIDTPSYQKMVEMNASMAGFLGGEQLTMSDLLHGTILSSGGEAASSLAIAVSGNEEDFVFEMNQVAKGIPMENSHFVNSVGMDDANQKSTALDIAKLLDKALDNSTFKDVFTKKLYWATKNQNHPDGLLLENTVLKEIPENGHPGIIVLGGKSGTTETAGLCWATLVKVLDKEYVLVTMGAPKELEASKPQWEDALYILSQLIDPKEKETLKDKPLVEQNTDTEKPTEETTPADAENKDGEESTSENKESNNQEDAAQTEADSTKDTEQKSDD
ncbi:MAG: D-alanyl-D-alanine carboxypeptidase [Tissierellia bacterium]|nr:D-alanyl-D-alanine carboxypeptidase [Tissierellia bacterium]